MKLYIDDTGKRVFLVGDDTVLACHLGFYLALSYPHLTKMGWRVCATKTVPSVIYHADRKGGVVASAFDLAQAIRKGPVCSHSCGRHEAIE